MLRAGIRCFFACVYYITEVHISTRVVCCVCLYTECCVSFVLVRFIFLQVLCVYGNLCVLCVCAHISEVNLYFLYFLYFRSC